MAERDRALERAHQLGREALHFRIGQGRQLIGKQLRRRQQIAQVVIDLRHRQTERRQPAFLMQHGGELALHGGELLFRRADFIAAAGFGNDARRIFRIGAERDHVRGDPPHRPHQQVMQREEHQHRGDAGDHQRQQQDVHGEGQHRLAQRRFVENDFDELAFRHRRRTDEPHHVVRLAKQQRVEGVHHGAPPRHVAHVDVLLDLRRHVGSGQQAALGAHLHRHGARADAFQDLLRQTLRHHAARRGVEHQRGGVRGGQPIVEPVEPEIGDRRDVNENFRHHHEQDGEEQQLAGKADARGPRRARRRQRNWLARWLGSRFQNRLNRRFAAKL